MNYSHGFHAGNAADVLKHGLLAAVLAYLKRKESPITVIDSHAGAGRYRLTPRGEWEDGAGRLRGRAVPALFAPYASAIADGLALEPPAYPGSPALALGLLRPQDRLIACETAAAAAAALKAAIGRDERASVHVRDGWTALKAFLPVPRGRCVVLIDPPFEAAGEFDRLADALALVAERAPTAIALGWYPIKGADGAARFHDRLRAEIAAPLLAAELCLEPRDDPRRLAGSGVALLRPPFGFEEALAGDLPQLLRLLGKAGSGDAAAIRLDAGAS